MTIMDSGRKVAESKRVITVGSEARAVGAGLTCEVCYTNFTKYDLYVKTQANLPMVLTPATTVTNADERRPHLEVVILYRIAMNDSIFKTFELLDRLEANNAFQGEEVVRLKDRLTTLYKEDGSRMNKRNFTFSVMRRYYEETFRREFSLYLREVDMVVSINADAMKAPHPNSNEGLQQVDVTRDKVGYNQAGIYLKCVDNEQLCGRRYYYAGKQLITVPSIVDKSLHSGVHCTVLTTDEHGTVTPVSKYLTFEQAEKEIGLYNNQEAALSHGDPELIHRSREAEAKRDDRMLSMEERKLRHEHEVEKMENDRRFREVEERLKESSLLLEKMRTERSILEEEISRERAWRTDILERREKYRKDYYDDRSHHRKDYYEDRSSSRKDWSEFLKTAPVLITGALAVYALVQSKNSRSLA